MPKQETAVTTVSKGSYERVKNELAAMAGKAMGLRKELKAERGTPGALASVGVATAGAALSGALAGFLGDANGQIGGLPIEVLFGVAALGLGTGAGYPWLIEAGGGAISGFAQASSFAAVKSFMKPAAKPAPAS